MTRHPVSLALVLAVVAACACVVSVVGLLGREPVPPRAVAAQPVDRPVAQPVADTGADPGADPGEPADPGPAGVLAAWDAARAAAWARGDPDALAALYVPGAAAGRRDVTMLRAWGARGLVVDTMATQLLAVEPLARSPGRWTLRVTDRLVGARAVGAGVSRVLPVDAASTRTVELRRLDGAWRVASVRRAGGGAAPGEP